MTYLFTLRDSRKTHTTYSEHTFNVQRAVERLIKFLINGNHLRPGPTFFIGFTPRWSREGMDGGNELCGVIITTFVLMLDRSTRSRAEYVQTCMMFYALTTVI